MVNLDVMFESYDEIDLLGGLYMGDISTILTWTFISECPIPNFRTRFEKGNVSWSRCIATCVVDFPKMKLVTKQEIGNVLFGDVIVI